MKSEDGEGRDKGGSVSRYAYKSTWDTIYKEELKQFDETKTLGDEWYDSYQDRVIEWIDEAWDHWFPELNQSRDVPVLDIGTGNGLFLLRLSSIGFSDLYGIDYLESAVRCADKFSKCVHSGIAHLDDLEIRNLPKFAMDDIMDTENICLREDILDGKRFKNMIKTSGPTMIHDKGTLDVFYFTSEIPKMIKNVETKYTNSSSKVIWIISTGNLTQDELIDNVTKYSEFKLLDILISDDSISSYTYQGAKGNTLTTIAFYKNRKN